MIASLSFRILEQTLGYLEPEALVQAMPRYMEFVRDELVRDPVRERYLLKLLKLIMLQIRATGMNVYEAKSNLLSYNLQDYLSDAGRMEYLTALAALCMGSVIDPSSHLQDFFV